MNGYMQCIMHACSDVSPIRHRDVRFHDHLITVPVKLMQIWQKDGSPLRRSTVMRTNVKKNDAKSKR